MHCFHNINWQPHQVCLGIAHCGMISNYNLRSVGVCVCFFVFLFFFYYFYHFRPQSFMAKLGDNVLKGNYLQISNKEKPFPIHGHCLWDYMNNQEAYIDNLVDAVDKLLGVNNALFGVWHQDYSQRGVAWQSPINLCFVMAMTRFQRPVLECHIWSCFWTNQAAESSTPLVIRGT